MLLSMTGHGDAAGENDRLSVAVEVKSVNNRHLKVSVRCPDAFVGLESKVERLIRARVSRGTLNVSIRVRQLNDSQAARINLASVREYWRQLTTIAADLKIPSPTNVSALLDLPGIVEEDFDRSVGEQDWPLLEQVVIEALTNFETFRVEEGRMMSEELRSLASVVEENVDEVARRAPVVVDDYRNRLKARVNEMLAATQMNVDDNDLIREVSLFADRCDITEEITRLRAHLQQYRTQLSVAESTGRKLEFLGQEMFREINTIGSKANDVSIAHRVVEMKSAIEKMREIIQNVE